MNLNSILKSLKTNEPAISTALGALVVLTVAILLVNYFKGRDSANILPPAAQTEMTQGPVSLPAKHTVAQGEHLWQIAEKYYKSGYNWVDIAEANNLSNPSQIDTGVELSIPQVEAKTLTFKDSPQIAQAPPTAEPENTQNSIIEDTYKTVQGDHLWGIAVRAYGDGYKWVEIAKTNNLKNPNLIFVDQELKLPR